MKTAGEKIRACREDKGLTRAQLGEKLGVTDACIGAWELGKRSPTLTTLSKIASALEVHPVSLLPDWFLFGGHE